jgi:hypothetical protein
MQERLNAKITLELTTPEGKAWHKTELTYVDLPIVMAVQIEQVGAKAIGELVALGVQSIEQQEQEESGKANKPQIPGTQR